VIVGVNVLINYLKRKEVMEFGPSNVGKIRDDCRALIGNLMRELAQRDAHARNNGLPTHFPLEEIQNIASYDNDFKRRCIQQFQAQTQYVVLSPDGRIALTQAGRNHFNEFQQNR
jgi:hypothetical protein